MDNKQKSIFIFFFSLLLISLNLIKDNSAVANDTQGWGSKQICSILGDEHKYFPLDLDIYTFKGIKGENVVINLDADPSGSHRTERATLILTGRYKHFLKIDRSSLPNSITTVLPSTGEYFILVIEQFTSKWSKGFKGKYCLTVKSTGEGWQSFRPFKPSDWYKYPITWVPETIEQTIELGQTAEATVSFVSRTSLRNANLWVVPELQPFISVEPKHFDTIDANIPYQVTIRFSAPQSATPRTYDGTIHLKVGSKTYPQTLKVKLNIICAVNVPPVANAGQDQVIALPEGQTTIDVQLDGSASHDPDGSIVSYTWTGTPDPEDIVNPTLKLKQGIYDFTLQVTDDKGATSSDSIKVTVLGPPLLIPLPEVIGEQAITIKGISIPGATITIINKSTDETKEVLNEKGLFEVSFDLSAGLNEFEAVAIYQGVQSTTAKLKTTYTSSQKLVLESISPSSGQSGSIITLTGLGFTPDKNIMGVYFKGPEVDGRPAIEGKGVVLEASETELKVILPFIFLKSDEDIEVYVYDNQNMSNSIMFHVSPAMDPTPDIKGNEVNYQLDLILEGLYEILTKITRFAKPRMPSEQWSIVEGNMRRMIEALEIIKSKLNSIPDDNNVKSNLDSLFSSDIFLVINEKLEEINEILSHSTEGESYCNLGRVIRILREVIEPIRVLNRILDDAIATTWGILVGDSIACFFGCVPCCVIIPILAEVVSTLSAIDGIVNTVLGIFNNVIEFLEGVVPTEAINWKVIVSGPFKGIEPHILYTNTRNTLIVHADFVSKSVERLLGDVIDINISIPDPFGMCSLIHAITQVDPCSLLGDLLGEGIVSYVLDILPIEDVFRVTATDLPVISTISAITNDNILSLTEGYATFEHSILTHSNTGQVLLDIQSTCGEYNYQQYFQVEVIQNPTLYGPMEWQADQFCYDTIVHTCYENGRYFCTREEYRGYLSTLCEAVGPGDQGYHDCTQYEACYFYDSESGQYIETCDREDYQGLLDNLCGLGGNCEELINQEIGVCLPYGHWVFGGKGFGVPVSPYCYPTIFHSCYYQGRYLCDLDEYRNYLHRLCEGKPYSPTCARVELCYDPEQHIHLCDVSEYEELLEALCGGTECPIINEEVEVCDPGGFSFKAYWNGEPIQIGSPSFDSFNIYSSPSIGFMKPGRLSVSIEGVNEIRESSTIFVPPSPNLNAQLSIINQSLYPGDTLYIKGNYFTAYEEDMELLFTAGNNALPSGHPSEVLVKSYDSPEDLLLFRMPPLIDEGNKTIDITVKAGPPLPCHNNNCSRSEFTILPYETAGTTPEDDQDLMIWGVPYGYIRSAAFGDLNGDGINDLVVGVPSDGTNFGIAFGAIYIKFGEIVGTDYQFENISKKIIDIGTNWDVKIVGDTRDVASGGNTRRIGKSLSIADLNGDGIGDLIIGTTDRDEKDDHRVDFGNTVSPAHLPGKVYVIYGRPDWQQEYYLSNENHYDVKFFGDDNRELGYQVGAGRIYGHDHKDLVITAPTDALNQLTSRAYILSGWNGSLPKKNIQLPNDLSIFEHYAIIESSDLDQMDNFTGRLYKGDGMGKSLTIGDINGDGLDEIVLGAPQYSQVWSRDPWSGLQGAIYIFGSRIYDHQPLQGWYFADAKVESNDYLVIWGPRIQYANEVTGFGKAVHVVDLNNDGKGEIIIGAPSTPVLEASIGPFIMSNEMKVGRVYVIDGANPALDGQRLTADYDADLIINGSTSISRFGYSLASGDINGDGIRDLLVGTPGRGENSGRVWAMYGTNNPFWRNTSGQDFVSLQTRKRIPLDLLGEYRDSGYPLDNGSDLENDFDYLILGAQYKEIDAPQFGAFVIAGDLDSYIGDDILIIDPIADSPYSQYSGMVYVFSEGSQELRPLNIYPEAVNMNYCDSEQLFTISGGLTPYRFKWGRCYQTYLGEPPYQTPGEVLCSEDLPLPDNFEVTYGENTVLLRINGCISKDLRSFWLKVIDSPLHGASTTREINFLKPDISVTPLNVNFGDVALGGTRTVDITVSNSGNLDLQISDISMTGSGDISYINHCPQVLQPQGSCMIEAIFTPTVQGLATANIYIKSNDPDTPEQRVFLSGNGKSPALSLSPGILDMGDATTSNLLYIMNNQATCVTPLNWEIAGNLPSWLSLSHMSGSITECGGAYAVTVQVNRSGLPVGIYSHTILVTSNSGSGSVEIRMGVPSFISVTPAAVDFAEAKKRLPMMIQNASSETALTWNIPADLPSWLTASQMSGVIPAGGSTTVYLYTNRSGLIQNQTYSHTLFITSNGGNLTIPVSLSVPVPLATFAKYYGGDGWEYFSKIRPTSDGGFIAAGISNSFSSSYGYYYAWVLKLDSSGYIEWEKMYGPVNPDQAYEIRETADGGYIMAAGSYSFANYHGLWLVKLNGFGEIVWDKFFEAITDDYFGYLGVSFSIQEAINGNFIIAGNRIVEQPNNDSTVDVWVINIDSSGNILWEKTYGGSHDDYAHSIQVTEDRGYVIAGVTRSFTADNNRDMWVLKLDSNGNIQWQKTYGGTGWDIAHEIQQTSDRGYIIVGYSSFGGALVLKLNPLGGIEWQKTYGGFDGYGHSIKQTQDGGYIFTGSYYRADRGDDIWVVKLDPMGNIEWQKTYGGGRVDEAYSIEQTEEGDYILAGYTNSFRSDPYGPNYDAFVLKIDSVGNIGESCGIVEWTSIAPEDTHIDPINTSITAINSTTTPRDTNATVIDSSALTGTPCSETEEQAQQKPLIDIYVFPTSYDFTYWYPDLRIGESASQVFIVRNTGYQPLSISNISLSGSLDFTGSHNCPLLPEALGIAHQCEITVSFTPSIVDPQGTSLWIESNDPDESSIEIPITGSGRVSGEGEGGGGETPVPRS